MPRTAEHEELFEITREDVKETVRKDREYGASWKKRGGVSAFMMLARKWDRIEEQVERDKYDIFESLRNDQREEGLLDDIRDLRRYLLLVENHVLHHTEDAVHRRQPGFIGESEPGPGYVDQDR